MILLIRTGNLAPLAKTTSKEELINNDTSCHYGGCGHRYQDVAIDLLRKVYHQWFHGSE